MINLNCDLCGKTLMLDEDVRYVVNIEVFCLCEREHAVEFNASQGYLQVKTVAQFCLEGDLS